MPEGLYYHKEFAWARVEDGKIRIGITDYAQKQLREIVYVELPSVGDTTTQNDPFGTVESVKAVSDLVAPISGTIEEVNEELESKP
ncbi:glycine cleavage system protein H, partial [Candidatus Bathyarchaeota archaeon]|nr:glycine cleavage system protein H [Candidatus Bathyarchaeota archaeon]